MNNVPDEPTSSTVINQALINNRVRVSSTAETWAYLGLVPWGRLIRVIDLRGFAISAVGAAVLGGQSIEIREEIPRISG